MKIKKQTSGQSGVSAIEFAILLPVLLLILFGIIEFSVLFYNKAMITNASREGARYAVTYHWDNDTGGYNPPLSEIEPIVQNYCNNMLITFGGTNAVTTTLTELGVYREVRVSYDYDWLILPDFASNLVYDGNISARTRMRRE